MKTASDDRYHPCLYTNPSNIPDDPFVFLENPELFHEICLVDSIYLYLFIRKGFRILDANNKPNLKQRSY